MSTPMIAAGHQAEIGERRVAAADARPPEEDLAEAIASATCCIFEPGSVMAMNRWPASCGAHRLHHAVVEVLLEDVRLERRSRLARHDEQRVVRDRSAARTPSPAPGRSNRGRGARGSRRCVPKVAFITSGQRLEPPMPISRTSEMPALFATSAMCREALHVCQLLVRDAEPAEPRAFVLAGPDRGVALPRAGASCPAPATRPAIV